MGSEESGVAAITESVPDRRSRLVDASGSRRVAEPFSSQPTSGRRGPDLDASRFRTRVAQVKVRPRAPFFDLSERRGVPLHISTVGDNRSTASWGRPASAGGVGSGDRWQTDGKWVSLVGTRGADPPRGPDPRKPLG